MDSITTLVPSPFHMEKRNMVLAPSISQMTPRCVDRWVKSNPRQVVKVDILGDLVELPVYALRRRNAMVHI
ncbi:hypothetical protein K501DRAFT_282418 [Backusella circina FSU 941]|nr:hypothetical protein K501DRAFT_282418 [Backusella circina FSU 941]